MNTTRIGLLPFYIALYDDLLPGKRRKPLEDFYAALKESLQRKGLEVVTAPVCRLEKGFKAAVQKMERADVDAIVTLHLAYSPSLESADAHRRSIETGLAVRRWIEENKLTAFTANFLDVTPVLGLPIMPFLEASLGMARGIGYAGEGDTLTAGLVGALAVVFPQTTFAEMFCPDWKGNRIYLSHMGEVNIDLLAGKPELVEYKFVFGKVPNPVKLAGCLRSGKAVWINLAPVAGGKFRLIVVPAKMEEGGKKGPVHWCGSRLDEAGYVRRRLPGSL